MTHQAGKALLTFALKKTLAYAKCARLAFFAHANLLRRRRSSTYCCFRIKTAPLCTVTSVNQVRVSGCKTHAYRAGSSGLANYGHQGRHTCTLRWATAVTRLHHNHEFAQSRLPVSSPLLFPRTASAHDSSLVVERLQVGPCKDHYSSQESSKTSRWETLISQN